MYKYTFLLLIIFFTSANIFAQTSQRTVIKLAKEVTVNRDKLRLGEIAEIFDAKGSIKEMLENISLGYSPQVGTIREISREKVKLAIATIKLPNNQIHLDMHESVIIHRASQLVDLELIRQEVERVTLSGLEANGATTRLVRLDLPAEISVPSGEIKVKAIVPAVRNTFAPFIVLIEIWVDNVLVRRISSNSEIEAYTQVVIAKKHLKAGTKLNIEDLVLKPNRLKYPINQYIRDLKVLRGFSLAKNIAPDEPLLIGNVVASIVVRQGDLVQVIATNDKLTIQAKAEAITAGRIGDKIKIKSSLSETLIDAIVIDEGVVKVSF
ncbi:MAG: flagellar basal body P-ring formation chaperone FlgA [Blastocatellia bacterium]